LAGISQNDLSGMWNINWSSKAFATVLAMQHMGKLKRLFNVFAVGILK